MFARRINNLFKVTWFPLAAQLFALFVFAALVVGGLLVDTDDMAFAKVVRNTNLSNLVVWSYWWPIIILLAIFLGRVWCTVCPMELITSLASRIGLRRPLPAFLRSGWVMTILYVVVLFVGIQTLSIHRIPYRMALYMLTLFGLAVVSGLVFSRNALCAHICPVGHLLGLYSRLAPMGWGVRDRSVCIGCKDQSCISAKNAYQFQGRSCGVGLRPVDIDDNAACLLCGQCLKTCNQNNDNSDGRPNPGWYPRRWFDDLLNLNAMKPAQTGFALVASGFVIYEVFTEWQVTKDILLWTPEQVWHLLGADGKLGYGLVKSLILFLGVPALLWFFPFVVFRLTGGRLALGKYLLRFGISFIPIMAAAHATKALLKMTSRIPYWEFVGSDPLGVDSARGLIDKTLQPLPLPVWRDPVVTAISLVLMGVGVGLSILVTKRLIATLLPKDKWSGLPFYLIPVLYGGGGYVMLIAWRGVQYRG